MQIFLFTCNVKKANDLDKIRYRDFKFLSSVANKSITLHTWFIWLWCQDVSLQCPLGICLVMHRNLKDILLLILTGIWWGPRALQKTGLPWFGALAFSCSLDSLSLLGAWYRVNSLLQTRRVKSVGLLSNHRLPSLSQEFQTNSELVMMLRI